MQGLLVFVSVLGLLAPVFSAVRPNSSVRKIKYITKEFIRPTGQAAKVGVDLCETCIEFAGQAINELLNIILNAGVVGTCGKLCSLLEQKTGSQALGVVCDLLCDIVGIEEFIKIVQKEDLDPIYYCELVKVCPIFDGGDCKITSLTVTPASGPQGEFDIAFTYSSQNGTGTGEIDFEIDTVDKIPVGENFLNKKSPAGSYDGSLKVKAQPDPSCDPSQQPCEMWLPGTYTVNMAVCNGECGSKHPHSKVYDQKSTTFTITG